MTSICSKKIIGVMKNIKLFIPILSIFAVSAFAQEETVFDEIWEFDSENEAANTIDGDYTAPYDINTLIDVSNGSLTVTGHFENKGITTIKGANTISADGTTTQSEYSFNATGTNQHNRNQLILENVNINMGNFYNERGGGLNSISPLLTVKGYVTFSNNLTTKQYGTILISEGAKLEILNGKSFAIENSVGTLKFENATKSQFIAPWEFKNQSESVYDFTITNDSLECVDASTAVIQARFVKSLNGKILLDFTNLMLNDDFVAGETYKIALINSYSGEANSGQFDDSWQILAENVLEGEFAKFAGFTKDNNVLYVNIQAVPEPATYAAIFGAIALLIAAYRRKK